LVTFELRGVEALLRWSRADGVTVSPRDFIRVAEETGMVHRLSQYALEIAISDLAEWRRRFDHAPWLAVNISGVQFREPDFVRELSVLLHRHRVPPHQVHLEITEEVLIENLERNQAILNQLNEIGMPIAVDDFGVGYSSLGYIKNFPISTLKIDQGFIRELDEDAEDQAITRTICNLARDLKLDTVAEGIERECQLEFLQRYGCALGQGFLFMRPSPAERISAVLAGDIPWAKLLNKGADRLRQPRRI
ncbi:MAG: EAL domain-containing protein, partial [Xanthomonadaceae bacterium]|nr:EAL domain-containing protein [Xanthomonadaceae bacterium]